MATHNFERCMDHIFRSEGGYVDHPADPGGATNMGITIGTLRDFRGRPVTKEEVKSLPKSEALEIYRKRYWSKVRGDDLPPGVDLAVVDYAVNSGPSRAAMHLQEVVGVAADGKIGPLTLAAVDKWDSIALIEALCGKRMSFLKRLSTWPTFGKGWSSRVTGVLRLAKDMAIAFPAPAPARPVAPSKPAPAPIPPTSASPKRKTLSDLFKGWFVQQATTHALNTIVKETPMNTNLLHNLLNIAIALVAILSLPEVTSLLPPDIALAIVGAAATAKTIINVIRDGLTGLVKNQPPVR